MRRKSLFIALLLGVFFLLSTSLQAQTNNNDPSSVNVGGTLYKKKTVISFDTDSISGDLTKPDGEYIEARKGFKHEKLIKLREHWRDKLLQSVTEL